MKKLLALVVALGVASTVVGCTGTTAGPVSKPSKM